MHSLCSRYSSSWLLLKPSRWRTVGGNGALATQSLSKVRRKKYYCRVLRWCGTTKPSTGGRSRLPPVVCLCCRKLPTSNVTTTPDSRPSSSLSLAIMALRGSAAAVALRGCLASAADPGLGQCAAGSGLRALTGIQASTSGSDQADGYVAFGYHASRDGARSGGWPGTRGSGSGSEAASTVCVQAGRRPTGLVVVKAVLQSVLVERHRWGALGHGDDDAAKAPEHSTAWHHQSRWQATHVRHGDATGNATAGLDGGGALAPARVLPPPASYNALHAHIVEPAVHPGLRPQPHTH